MKKILIALSSLVLLVGCNNNVPADAQSVQLPQPPADEQQAPAPTYSNSEFSFEYPKDLTVEENVDLVAGKGVRVNGLGAYGENTNLNSADIEITSGDLASCKDDNLFGVSLAAGVSTVVNGTTFKLDTYQDAGAGHRADSKVYSVVHNDKCYRIALVTQYTVLENYENPPKTFDKVKLEKVEADLVASFKFKN